MLSTLKFILYRPFKTVLSQIEINQTQKKVFERERFERGRVVRERDRERKKRESGKEIG